MPNDRHVRRTGSDYAAAFFNLLPTGPAWPRDLDKALSLVVTGLTKIFGDVDGRAADLLEIESDPSAANQLLTDWERAWALPDNCIPTPSVDPVVRRVQLVAKMTLLGDQSRSFFIGQSAVLGQTITIREYAPYMTGVSGCGDTTNLTADGFYRWQLGPPENRFYWTVHGHAAGTGVQCILRRYKPAHTAIVFTDLSGVVEQPSPDYNAANMAIYATGG